LSFAYFYSNIKIMLISDLLGLIDISKKTMENSDYEETIQRLLIIECKHNLNVLGLLNTKDLKKQSTYYRLFEQLESNFIEIYLSQNYLHKSFFSKIKDAFRDNDDSSDDLLQNILLKIKILKTISQFEDKSDLKKFRLEIRIKNLKDKLSLLYNMKDKKK